MADDLQFAAHALGRVRYLGSARSGMRDDWVDAADFGGAACR